MKQSNRKLYNVMIGVLFGVCQMIPLALIAQEGEMPITTSSEEALQLFLEGRDNYEFVENAASAQRLEKAIEKDPDFALAYLYRFRTGIGGTKVAQQYLTKAVGLLDKVSPGEKYFILFFKAQVDGEGAKQKEYLDKLLELFPSDKRVQEDAGLYFQFTEMDYPTALQYYQRVTELDKAYAPVYDAIAFAHISLGNIEEAEKAFLAEINLAPERPNPRDSYGYFLLKHGRNDESIKQYTLAFEKDSSFTGALAGLGDNYFFKGEYKTSREYYEKALDKAASLKGYGGKFNTLNRIASSFVLEDNIDEALNTYKRYRSLAEENSQTEEVITSFQNEGFILTETGNPSEGLKRYQMAVKIVHKPDTPEEIKKNRTLQCMFAECYALHANNDVEAALAKMETCEKMAKKRQVPSDQRWMNFLKGLVQSKKSNYSQAIEHYSKSWPNNATVKFNMAQGYEKIGQKEKASELFDELQTWNQVDLASALVKYRMRKVDKK